MASPPSDSSDGGSPPRESRAGLKAWWKQFTLLQRAKKEAGAGGVPNYRPGDPNAVQPGTVFGVPLRESLKYASVQISTADAKGELYVWGYVPVVVAKCGLYLKENATEVPGTFRVSGSAKRMRDLQNIFEKPPKYGKSLDWKKESYTTHDVASVFRRYLTQMPEPVIPHTLYHQFRDTMAKKPFDHDEAIKTNQRLIRSMPRANQYLLLYVLDLLSVFARKSEINLMPASNLALIFRPGLISHPSHEMSPEEHQLSLQVLEFLIAEQDYFMMDMSPPPLPPTPASEDPQPQFPLPSPGSVVRDAGGDAFPPSESDEDAPEGGWKLVERPSAAEVAAAGTVHRRRTTSQTRTSRRQHTTPAALSASPDPAAAAAPSSSRTPASARPTLSPVHSSDEVVPKATGANSPSSAASNASGSGVKRSRTLPTSRKGADGREGRERERGAEGKKVLSKRQKRLSQQQPAGTGSVGQQQQQTAGGVRRAVEAPT